MLRRVLDYRILIPLAIFLGLAPFHPEPHLVGKFRLLSAGALKRPVDTFDLFWHAWPLTLLGFRIGRDMGHALGNKGGAS